MDSRDIAAYTSFTRIPFIKYYMSIFLEDLKKGFIAAIRIINSLRKKTRTDNYSC